MAAFPDLTTRTGHSEIHRKIAVPFPETLLATAGHIKLSACVSSVVEILSTSLRTSRTMPR